MINARSEMSFRFGYRTQTGATVVSLAAIKLEQNCHWINCSAYSLATLYAHLADVWDQRQFCCRPII